MIYYNVFVLVFVILSNFILDFKVEHYLFYQFFYGFYLDSFYMFLVKTHVSFIDIIIFDKYVRMLCCNSDITSVYRLRNILYFFSVGKINIHLLVYEWKINRHANQISFAGFSSNVYCNFPIRLFTSKITRKTCNLIIFRCEIHTNLVFRYFSIFSSVRIK